VVAIKLFQTLVIDGLSQNTLTPQYKASLIAAYLSEFQSLNAANIAFGNATVFGSQRHRKLESNTFEIPVMVKTTSSKTSDIAVAMSGESFTESITGGFALMGEEVLLQEQKATGMEMLFSLRADTNSDIDDLVVNNKDFAADIVAEALLNDIIGVNAMIEVDVEMITFVVLDPTVYPTEKPTAFISGSIKLTSNPTNKPTSTIFPTMAPSEFGAVKCLNSEGFQDARGYSCSGWAGYNCLDESTWTSYTPNELLNIASNCRLACGLCDWKPDEPLVRGAGGLKVYDGISFTAEVYYDGSYHPICGLDFSDGNTGATLVCRELGFTNGIVEQYEAAYLVDAMPIGKCNPGDHLKECSGGGNAWGEFTYRGGSCAAGNTVSIEIICSSSAVCPSPFVPANAIPDVPTRDQHACVQPCPSAAYTPEEYTVMWASSSIVALCALLLNIGVRMSWVPKGGGNHISPAFKACIGGGILYGMVDTLPVLFLKHNLPCGDVSSGQESAGSSMACVISRSSDHILLAMVCFISLAMYNLFLNMGQAAQYRMHTKHNWRLGVACILVPFLLMVISYTVENDGRRVPNAGLNVARQSFQCSMRFPSMVLEWTLLVFPTIAGVAFTVCLSVATLWKMRSKYARWYRWKTHLRAVQEKVKGERRNILQIAFLVSFFMLIHVLFSVSAAASFDGWSKSSETWLDCSLEHWRSRSWDSYAFIDGQQICRKGAIESTFSPFHPDMECNSDCFYSSTEKMGGIRMFCHLEEGADFVLGKYQKGNDSQLASNSNLNSDRVESHPYIGCECSCDDIVSVSKPPALAGMVLARFARSMATAIVALFLGFSKQNRKYWSAKWEIIQACSVPKVKAQLTNWDRSFRKKISRRKPVIPAANNTVETEEPEKMPPHQSSMSRMSQSPIFRRMSPAARQKERGSRYQDDENIQSEPPKRLDFIPKTPPRKNANAAKGTREAHHRQHRRNTGDAHGRGNCFKSHARGNDMHRQKTSKKVHISGSPRKADPYRASEEKYRCERKSGALPRRNHVAREVEDTSNEMELMDLDIDLELSQEPRPRQHQPRPADGHARGNDMHRQNTSKKVHISGSPRKADPYYASEEGHRCEQKPGALPRRNYVAREVGNPSNEMELMDLDIDLELSQEPRPHQQQPRPADGRARHRPSPRIVVLPQSQENGHSPLQQPQVFRAMTSPVDLNL
jgi:hypothetical protein